VILVVLAGISALFVWAITDTGLKREHVEHSDGQVKFRATLLTVVVQAGLWIGVYLVAARFPRWLPDFLVSGWRLPLVLLASFFVEWFAALMILEFAWKLFSATVLTAIYGISLKIQDRRLQKLENEQKP
jgi:hypothetical protein